MFNSKKTNDIFYIKSGTTPNTVNKDFYEKEDVNWLNSGDFHNSLIYKTNKKISFEAKKQSNLKEFKVNSIVIAMYGANVGEVGLLKIKTTVNQACAVLSPKKKINSHYYYYYFISHKNKFIAQANGGGQANINQQIISNTYIPYPHFEQQTAIANFLDHQTSKIDKEISLLEKKVELLDELKQSTIYEAVTKGLNPDVKMKDSGIEWIGMIPEHWEVKRVKEIAKWMTGFTPPSNNEALYDGLDTWVTIRDLSDEKYICSSAKTIDGSLVPKHWKTPKNSLLFSFKLSIGQVAFNTEDLFTNEAICSFLPSSKIDLNYLYYSSPVFIVKNCKTNIYGADLLNQELIANAITLIPSKKEQTEITLYLDDKLQSLDNYKNTHIKKIELLKEYKQSLIYEAVTGKIDIPQEYQLNNEDNLILNQIVEYSNLMFKSTSDSYLIESLEDLEFVKKELEDKYA